MALHAAKASAGEHLRGVPVQNEKRLRQRSGSVVTVLLSLKKDHDFGADFPGLRSGYHGGHVASDAPKGSDVHPARGGNPLCVVEGLLEDYASLHTPIQNERGHLDDRTLHNEVGRLSQGLQGEGHHEGRLGRWSKEETGCEQRGEGRARHHHASVAVMSTRARVSADLQKGSGRGPRRQVGEASIAHQAPWNCSSGRPKNPGVGACVQRACVEGPEGPRPHRGTPRLRCIASWHAPTYATPSVARSEQAR